MKAAIIVFAILAVSFTIADIIRLEDELRYNIEHPDE